VCLVIIPQQVYPIEILLQFKSEIYVVITTRATGCLCSFKQESSLVGSVRVSLEGVGCKSRAGIVTKYNLSILPRRAVIPLS